MMPVKRFSCVLIALLVPALWLSGQTPAAKHQAATPAVNAKVEEYMLWLPDCSLIVEPGGGSLEIKALGTVISKGGGWDRQRVRPYLYFLRRASWRGHYWQVNTKRREVRLVWDGTFGVKWKMASLTARDDDGVRLDLAVDVAAAAADQAPARFSIRFPSAQLIFVPSTGAFRLAGAGTTLSPGLEWQSVRLQDGLYQIRLDAWKNYFWQVDTRALQGWRVHGAGAVFGQAGGQKSLLALSMAKSSTSIALAEQRVVLKAAEQQALRRLAEMIAHGEPAGRIQEASAAFALRYPDIDPDAAMEEVLKELRQISPLAREIEDLEKKADEFRNKRQEFETAFENYDQKSNQLFNILSTVLKTIKETQGAAARNML